jgi:hypothetical protein
MSGLSEIATKSPTAEAIVKTLASRKNNATATELDAIVNSPEVEKTGARPNVKRDAIVFFRDLEKIGYGQFVVGRRGRSTRFIWSRPLRDLATQAVAFLSASDADQPTPPEMLRPQREGPPSQIAHSFAVRPALSVTFELPEDLTAAEAERLANLIRNIPFIP